MTFIRVTGNPEPEGAEEIWLEGRGGVQLRLLLAPARGAARGSVILCSGRTEFIEKYFEVVRDLQARGFAVFTMDWRGQGLSAREAKNPQKGHFSSLDEAAMDLSTALRLHADKLPRPHIVLAHSMGGAIALRALQTRRIDADAAIFSAPMWGIPNLTGSTKSFARLATALGAGRAFAPGVDRRWRREPFRKNVVTHDKERYAVAQGLIEEDTRLALAGPTIAWVTAAANAIDGFRKPNALAHLRMPIVVVSAGDEKLVDNESHRAIAAALPNATHQTIAKARHELLMETDDLRDQFWAAFDALADKAAPRAA